MTLVNENPHHNSSEASSRPAADKPAFTSWFQQHWKVAIPLAALGLLIVSFIAGFIFYFASHNTANAAHTSKQTATASQTPTSNFNVSKLWNSNAHGILAFAGSNTVTLNNDSGIKIPVSVPAYLELIDPNTGNVIAKNALPTSLQMTQLSNNRQFSLAVYNSAGGEPDFINEQVNYAMNANYRYIAVTFNQNSDGSQDVGYYDLATGKVTDISNHTQSNNFSSQTVTDTLPVFDDTNPNLLLFCRYGGGVSSNCASNYNQNYSYNLATKQTQPYNSSSCSLDYVNEGNSVGCMFPGKGSTASMLFDDDTGTAQTLSVFPQPYSLQNYTEVETMENGQEQPVDCSPVQWIDSSTILCDGTSTNANGMDGYFKVDLNAITMGSDGNYQVPNPVPVLPNNDRSNSTPIVSPDDKQAVFISTLGSNSGFYKVSLSGGVPTEIKALTGSKPDLLIWR